MTEKPKLSTLLEAGLGRTTAYMVKQPNGQIVQDYLIQEGAAFWGETRAEVSIERGGLVNHTLKTASLAEGIAKQLRDKGVTINPDLVFATHVASHYGRIAVEEAETGNKLGYEVPDQQEKDSHTYESYGVKLLEKADVSSDVLNLVKALAHGKIDVPEEVKKSWEYKVAVWADHITDQTVDRLAPRMGRFIFGQFLKPELKGDAATNQQILETINTTLEEIVQAGRKGEITLEEAIAKAQQLGAMDMSPRKLPLDVFMQLVLDDAVTEGEMIALGIDVDGISETNRPISRKEKYLKRLFIQDAEIEAFQQLDAQKKHSRKRRSDTFIDELNQQDPSQRWWTQETRRLYAEQQGKPQLPTRPGVAIGIQRGINFLKSLEGKRNN